MSYESCDIYLGPGEGGALVFGTRLVYSLVSFPC